MAKLQEIYRKSKGDSIFSLYLPKKQIILAGLMAKDDLVVKAVGKGKISIEKVSK